MVYVAQEDINDALIYSVERKFESWIMDSGHLSMLLLART